MTLRAISREITLNMYKDYYATIYYLKHLARAEKQLRYMQMGSINKLVRQSALAYVIRESDRRKDGRVTKKEDIITLH